MSIDPAPRTESSPQPGLAMIAQISPREARRIRRLAENFAIMDPRWTNVENRNAEFADPESLRQTAKLVDRNTWDSKTQTSSYQLRRRWATPGRFTLRLSNRGRGLGPGSGPQGEMGGVRPS